MAQDIFSQFYHIGELGFPEDTPLGKINYDKMLREKLSRTRMMMKKYDLGAVICISDINVAYCSNVPPIFMAGPAMGGSNRYAIVPKEGEPVVFEECFTAYVLRNTIPNIRVENAILGYGGMHQISAPEAQQFLTRKFAEKIHSILKEYKLDKTRIGIDVYIPQVIEELKKAGLDITLDGGKALFEARTIKTSEELECIRALATIIDGCHATLAKNLRAGVSEKEIWSKCVSYAIENGITTYGGFIVSGPHTWPKDNTRPYSSRRIRPGEVVYADFFNFSFNGYKSCYYRTYCVGKPTKEVRETYDQVRDWLWEAEKAVKPGATTRDVVEKWPDEEKLWSDKPPYIRSEDDKYTTFFGNVGHGLGLSLYEPPLFWRPVAMRWPQKLEAGMAIALETLNCTPDGKVGVRIEDMIIITDSGHEVISKWPTDEITEVPLF